MMFDRRQWTGTGRESVRSVFISDIHLGYAYSQADRLADFLSRIQPQYVYLVGDFIDGWELRRGWNWTPEFTHLLHRLVELTKQGVTIRYAIGNHDDFLRQNALWTDLVNIGGVEIAEEFVHLTSDERRFLVVHGDQFDVYGNCSQTFERVATLAYNLLLRGNDVWHWWFGGRHGILSARIRNSFTCLSRHVNRFRRLLSDHARKRDCHGVICGHIHAPEQTDVEGIEYCNTGDWLENCSAIVEYHDGRMVLEFAADRTRPSVTRRYTERNTDLAQTSV